MIYDVENLQKFTLRLRAKPTIPKASTHKEAGVVHSAAAAA